MQSSEQTQIYQISDLRGKSVALASAYPSVAIDALAGLVLGGLALENVKIVPAGSFTGGLEMLLKSLGCGHSDMVNIKKKL